MSRLGAIMRELVGLFVEDWAFALQIAALLATVVLLNAYSVGSANARALLLVGLPAIALLTSVARARRLR
jgi:hypothetical protein